MLLFAAPASPHFAFVLPIHLISTTRRVVYLGSDCGIRCSIDGMYLLRIRNEVMIWWYAS